MLMTPGPRRLILIRSGNFDYAEVVMGNSTHLVGPNNVGKTSLIATVQFLYIAAFSEMRFNRPWDESQRYYFQSDESTILFVGPLIHRKRLDILIRAMAMLESLRGLGYSTAAALEVRTSGGRRRVMSYTCCGAIWRGDGANTNPTASAPIATANSASSSLVMPQIFTNMRAAQYWQEAPEHVDVTVCARHTPLRDAEGLQGGAGVAAGDEGLADEDRVVARSAERRCIVGTAHP